MCLIMVRSRSWVWWKSGLLRPEILEGVNEGLCVQAGAGKGLCVEPNLRCRRVGDFDREQAADPVLAVCRQQRPGERDATAHLGQESLVRGAPLDRKRGVEGKS